MKPFMGAKVVQIERNTKGKNGFFTFINFAGAETQAKYKTYSVSEKASRENLTLGGFDSPHS
ncbi:MAG: hypothetical protein IKP41_08015 [Bacteroidaceae bacterium]|nr:hypothetical protein [Bacteroidaceae bacterium]